MGNFINTLEKGSSSRSLAAAEVEATAESVGCGGRVGHRVLTSSNAALVLLVLLLWGDAWVAGKNKPTIKGSFLRFGFKVSNLSKSLQELQK